MVKRSTAKALPKWEDLYEVNIIIRKKPICCTHIITTFPQQPGKPLEAYPGDVFAQMPKEILEPLIAAHKAKNSRAKKRSRTVEEVDSDDVEEDQLIHSSDDEQEMLDKDDQYQADDNAAHTVFSHDPPPRKGSSSVISYIGQRPPHWPPEKPKLTPKPQATKTPKAAPAVKKTGRTSGPTTRSKSTVVVNKGSKAKGKGKAKPSTQKPPTTPATTVDSGVVAVPAETPCRQCKDLGNDCEIYKSFKPGRPWDRCITCSITGAPCSFLVSRKRRRIDSGEGSNVTQEDHARLVDVCETLRVNQEEQRREYSLFMQWMLDVWGSKSPPSEELRQVLSKLLPASHSQSSSPTGDAISGIVNPHPIPTDQGSNLHDGPEGVATPDIAKETEAPADNEDGTKSDVADGIEAPVNGKDVIVDDFGQDTTVNVENKDVAVDAEIEEVQSIGEPPKSDALPHPPEWAIVETPPEPHNMAQHVHNDSGEDEKIDDE